MMLYQIKHRVTCVALFEGEAESLDECVMRAVRSGANLCGANLFGADLRDTIGIISAGMPNGWTCFAWLPSADHESEEVTPGIVNVRIGCRNKTLAQGREYWAGKDDRREVLAALDYVEAVARIREWRVK